MIIGGVQMGKRLSLVTAVFLYFCYLTIWIAENQFWAGGTSLAAPLLYIVAFLVTVVFTAGAIIVLYALAATLRELIKWVRHG